MKLTLISPRLAVQKNDFLGSGVPYWPIELATLAAFAREQGDEIVFIDLFGNNPKQLEEVDDHYLQGQPLDLHFQSSEFQQTEAFIIYAISYMSHQELLSITRRLKQRFQNKPVAILENSQAVTAYSLPHMKKSFFEAGAQALICGEPYFNWGEVKQAITDPASSSAPNVIISAEMTDVARQIQKGFRYPIPAWDLVNRIGYWNLPYSHGPKTPVYLPMLTSRGCPYPCDFCVVPETNDRRWRANAPEDVVEEMLILRNKFGVHDFQIEDLNPTVQHERWEKICELLIECNANIRFYFVSGTKAETVHLDKVGLFARAGCRYISISPESGSATLMKAIGKKFDYDHGLNLIDKCHQHGIRTQACILVGHPDEISEDFMASRNYLKRMVRCGLDEVAIFVVASFAGSKLYAQRIVTSQRETALPSFSPKGRLDYPELEKKRKSLIKTFFIEKLKRGFPLWQQGLRALFGTPQTKMENLPKRMYFIRQQIRKSRSLNG